MLKIFEAVLLKLPAASTALPPGKQHYQALPLGIRLKV